MTLNMIAMNCRFSAVGIAHNGSKEVPEGLRKSIIKQMGLK